MKTDRELLELSAKAVGHCVAACCDGKYWKTETPESEGIEHWNPLTDDGDALRLAVKLRNDITFNDALAMAWPANGADGESEPLDPDPYAATRRAITRAAAAMWLRENPTTQPPESAR